LQNELAEIKKQNEKRNDSTDMLGYKEKYFETKKETNAVTISPYDQV
jgi:hypothetical protein